MRTCHYHQVNPRNPTGMTRFEHLNTFRYSFQKSVGPNFKKCLKKLSNIVTFLSLKCPQNDQFPCSGVSKRGARDPQGAHVIEHRPSFGTVLTRFGDAQIRQAGGETFGTMHFRSPIKTGARSLL